MLEAAGIAAKYDHHETGPDGRMEIELECADLVRTADAILMAKYIVRNLAAREGRQAIFLPKPVASASGNGMHVHSQLWDGDRPLLAGGGYAGLSRLAMSFVAGILCHIGSLAAFTNPSTNSYRRLVPGFEAPVTVGFAVGNRSADIRIPGYATGPAQRRFEYRPLDATANPYLAFVALLMAGLDGVRGNLDPVELGFGPLEEQRPVSSSAKFPRTLEEALDRLEDDSEYLRAHDVFPEVLLWEWTALKRRGHLTLELEPHPGEFIMYGDL